MRNSTKTSEAASTSERAQKHDVGKDLFCINETVRARVGLLLQKSDPSDKDYITEVSFVCLNEIELGITDSIVCLVNVLIMCGNYYENIGLSIEAVQLGREALSLSLKSNDILLIRRSHNFLGGSYARACNFEKACAHLEAAHNLAQGIQDPIGIMASLGNSVSALECMGLLASAQKLALKLSKMQDESSVLSYIHFLNANNGIRISHLLGDIKAANIFSKIADDKKIAAEPHLSLINRAYYDATKITHLVYVGKLKEAVSRLERALDGSGVRTNTRVRTLFCIAESEVQVAMRNVNDIKKSRDVLIELLDDTIAIPTQYEETLRAIIRNCSSTSTFDPIESREGVSIHLRLLRDHLISVKHKYFFHEPSEIFYPDIKRSEELGGPSYEIPSWIRNINADQSKNRLRKGRTKNSGTKILENASYDIEVFEKARIKEGSRSQHYDIAENWAVAADFASGGDGEHCFRVGRFAGSMAVALGWSSQTAKELELACRLHDIGKTTMSFSKTDADCLRAFGQFSLVCEHAIAGEKLLAASGELVLQLAAKIAKNHHEWWNGCGYPLGISGEVIPIEARICLIATIYVGLLHPYNGRKTWSTDLAVRQVESMAGVQVDPGLVEVFALVASKAAWVVATEHSGVDKGSKGNALLNARTRFCRALELQG